MRLFVTVGTQVPFDRLIRAVDAWMARTPGVSGFAQIGPTDMRPASMPSVAFLSQDAFLEQVRSCTAIVAHAGIGSILTSLQYGRPILVMPRRAALREHRNDHQVATALRFRELDGVEVAMDETEIDGALERLRQARAGAQISPYAPEVLIGAIRDFIHAR